MLIGINYISLTQSFLSCPIYYTPRLKTSHLWGTDLGHSSKAMNQISKADSQQSTGITELLISSLHLPITTL